MYGRCGRLHEQEFGAWTGPGVAICKNVLLGAFRAQIVILTASAKSGEMVNFVEELRDIGVVCYRVGRIEDGLDYLLESPRMEGEGSGASDRSSLGDDAGVSHC